MRIEDYALIGDCQSAALVSREGSIDWLCWPRFDSPACFAALLGRPEHGHWRISPAGRYSARRAYRRDTLILETQFETTQGSASLVDFMPVNGMNSDLVRVVIGRAGSVAMEMEGVLRFDYGSAVPWIRYSADRREVHAIVGPDMVRLSSAVPVENRNRTTCARFEVRAGQRLTFVLTHGPSHLELPQSGDVEHALADTERFWRDWAARCTGCGDWDESVRRSLITLKALTYAPTGGMVAAPTMSLPERIGGIRNWDYRYCWLRDATLTLLALMDAGYFE